MTSHFTIGNNRTNQGKMLMRVIAAIKYKFTRDLRKNKM